MNGRWLAILIHFHSKKCRHAAAAKSCAIMVEPGAGSEIESAAGALGAQSAPWGDLLARAWAHGLIHEFDHSGMVEAKGWRLSESTCDRSLAPSGTVHEYDGPKRQRAQTNNAPVAWAALDFTADEHEFEEAARWALETFNSKSGSQGAMIEFKSKPTRSQPYSGREELSELEAPAMAAIEKERLVGEALETQSKKNTKAL